MTVACSALHITPHIAKAQEILWKRKQKGCQSQRLGKTAVKQYLMEMTIVQDTAQDITQDHCTGSLHRTMHRTIAQDHAQDHCSQELKGLTSCARSAKDQASQNSSMGVRGDCEDLPQTSELLAVGGCCVCVWGCQWSSEVWPWLLMLQWMPTPMHMQAPLISFNGLIKKKKRENMKWEGFRSLGFWEEERGVNMSKIHCIYVVNSQRII